MKTKALKAALPYTIPICVGFLFLGISMLDKYKNIGWKKWYLIYGMCDESFTINCTVTPPPDVDKGWFMFINQWEEAGKHQSALVGVGCSLFSLIIFGSGNFILPAMALIICCFSLGRKGKGAVQ